MVHGTFSPARAWRPAVVAPLARTLGHAKDILRVHYTDIHQPKSNAIVTQHHRRSGSHGRAKRRLEHVGAKRANSGVNIVRARSGRAPKIQSANQEHKIDSASPELRHFHRICAAASKRDAAPGVHPLASHGNRKSLFIRLPRQNVRSNTAPIQQSARTHVLQPAGSVA